MLHKMKIKIIKGEDYIRSKFDINILFSLVNMQAYNNQKGEKLWKTEF